MAYCQNSHTERLGKRATMEAEKMANMNAHGLASWPTHVLVQKYHDLDWNTTAQTFEQEARRMARLQEIASELGKRGVDPEGHPIVYP